MPIYEYRCDNCGHELEAFQKLGEAPLVQCPQCDQNALVKKISAAGFRLKGSGWYETDFKSGKKKNVSGSDGDSGSGNSSDTGGKDSGGSGESSSGSGTKNSSGSESGSKPSSAAKPAGD